MANWWEYFEHGWGNPFGVHGPAYNPQIGHRGTDHPAPAHSSLPAWETMTVVENASHPIVGNVVNLRAHSDGAYLGVAHALVGSRPNVGHTVHPGDLFVKAAGPGDFHGTAWFGSHFHIVWSSSIHAGQGLGHLHDARPRIVHLAEAAKAHAHHAANPHPTGWELAWGHEHGAPHWPVGSLMVRVQHGLRNHGWYHGPLDGHGGENTGKGIQLALAHDHLYSGPIDGRLGPAGAKGVQQFGHKHGGYTGPVDGDPREHSWTAFAHALGG